MGNMRCTCSRIVLKYGCIGLKTDVRKSIGNVNNHMGRMRNMHKKMKAELIEHVFDGNNLANLYDEDVNTLYQRVSVSKILTYRLIFTPVLTV